MIQLTVVTTLFGAVSAAAAIDAGLLGKPDSRVLVFANNAPTPEVTSDLTESPGADAALARFDRVVDLGALLHPQQPSRWKITGIDVPAQERLLRQYWRLDNQPVELVVESIHVPPAATIVRVFADARITALSEGLMSYGPTRNAQAHSLGQRIDALVYLDLVEGLEPILLSEHQVPQSAVPPAVFRLIIEEMVTAAGQKQAPTPAPTALVLGQYLSALRLVTPTQESDLQLSMLKAAQKLGAKRVLFKPHPSASSTNTSALLLSARSAGLEIETVDPRLSAEAVMASTDLVGVVAGFSTALATARRVFGIPTACVGTETILRSLEPFQNSNRIPLTIIDFLDRHDNQLGAIDELRKLTVAVSYAMQPKSLAHRRREAKDFLASASEETRQRYFRQGRLNVLRLNETGSQRPVASALRTLVDALPPGLQHSIRVAVAKVRRRTRD